ncbi:ribonuclease H [Myxococcus phage Mx1]|nr:ribonuclease H [Myxococcus phage Mx1]
MTVSVYSDGSSGSKGGKPGGWAYVIVRDEAQVLASGYGGSSSTTNNVMELTGAIKGLEALKVLKSTGVVADHELCELVSDSQYTLNMANGGWMPNANLELVEEIQVLAGDTLSLDKAGVPRTRWVPGHTGNTWNERCDKDAGKGKLEHTPPELLKKKAKKR